MGDSQQDALLMMGYKVFFPPGKTPFPAQRAVMSKALQALHKGQNALLESPTGTGKTLALLTSALAWQAHKIEELADEVTVALHPPEEQHEQQNQQQEVAMEGVTADDADSPKEREAKYKRPKIPRIYFASRTHSQLVQVVDEIRHLHPNYLDGMPDKGIPPVRMTMLASRQHLCVNKTVLEKAQNGGASIDEQCKELRREKRCFYNFGSITLQRQMPAIFDLEDAVKLGKKLRGCPYFAAQKLATEVHLVLCPYNFIVDPVVRSTAGIELEGSVVVIDEAHNTEDVVRSATSAEIVDWEIEQSLQQLEELAEGGQPWYQGLHAMLRGLMDWFDEVSALLFQKGNDDPEGNVWTGEEIIEILEARANVTLDTLPALKAYFSRLMDAQEDGFAEAALAEDSEADGAGLQSPGTASPIEPKYEEKVTVNGVTIRTLSGLFNVFHFLFAKNFANLRHYRMVVRMLDEQPAERSNRRDRRRKKNRQLCIWCLHASVGFCDIEEQCHSIILASGTLSPLDSFAGELGVDFPVRVEASHVIQPSQIWAGAMSMCNGHQLNCTYQYQDSPDLHDSVGHLLRFATQISPGGVLLFLPSYSFMNKIVARLSATGAAQELSAIAPIFCEPKESAELKQTLKDFQEEIHRSGKAVLIAVCRGKVSEGIDFSDSYARTVIVVGIPFPSIKDLHVKLKREHQNVLAAESPACVTGDVWYKQQAYRAINQAVGRCIRHRADFGAIVFADPRFRSQSVQQNLSRWLRPAVRGFECFEETLMDLREFFTSNLATAPAAMPKGRMKGGTQKSTPSPKGGILQFVSRIERIETPRAKSPASAAAATSEEEVVATETLDAFGKLVAQLQENMGYPSLSELPTPSFIGGLVAEADADYWCLYAIEPDALMQVVETISGGDDNPRITYEDQWCASDETLYRVFKLENCESQHTLVYCYATSAAKDSYRELLWIPLAMVGPPADETPLATVAATTPTAFATPTQKRPTKRKTRAAARGNAENVSPPNHGGGCDDEAAMESQAKLDEEFEGDDDFDLLQLSKTKKCLSAEQCRKRKGRR